jgi:hypothetical protein
MSIKIPFEIIMEITIWYSWLLELFVIILYVYLLHLFDVFIKVYI